MRENEFSEALGRLLTDGSLRDQFATDPDAAISSLCEDALVRADLVALKVEELEIQAEVLLRKRFELIRRILPGLVCRLETKAWPLFRQYGRVCWLPAPHDALRFAEYARSENPGEMGEREINCMRFTLEESVRVRFHWITKGRIPPVLQILVRSTKSSWREYVCSLRL